MNRKGFTIIELLMVVAIIGVLTGIVITIASGALQSARSKRAEAMRTMLENAIATAYAQDSNGKWIPALESVAESRKSIVLPEETAQAVFREVVKRSVGLSGTMNPLIDPTGLFVARKGIRDGKGSGYGYTDARQGDGKERQGIGPDQMDFGFQGRATGKFRRFNIIYHAQSDSINVTRCCKECAGVNGCLRRLDSNNPCPYCHKVEGE